MSLLINPVASDSNRRSGLREGGPKNAPAAVLVVLDLVVMKKPGIPKREKNNNIPPNQEIDPVRVKILLHCSKQQDGWIYRILL